MDTIIEEILEKKIYRESYILKKYYNLHVDVIAYNVGLNISWLNKLYNFIYKIKEKNKFPLLNSMGLL